jgi:hypothetical protein
VEDVAIGMLCLAGCVFAASARGKLSGRQAYIAYRAGLRQAALVPERFLPTVAAVLCAAEVAVAAGGLAAAAAATAWLPGSRLLSVGALAAATALTAVLVAGVALVVRRGSASPCACFGSGVGRPLGWMHLIRNLSLLVMIAGGLAGASIALARPALAGELLAVATGALASLLIIRWEELADLFALPPRSAPPSSGGADAVRSRRAADRR